MAPGRQHRKSRLNCVFKDITKRYTILATGIDNPAMGPQENLLLLAGGGFVLALLISVVATRMVLAILRRRNLLDIPNERSSHKIPTPRGGGWGLVIGAILASLVILPFTEALSGHSFWVIGLAVAIATGVILSWRDDLGGLPVRVRLLAQSAAVTCSLAALFWTGAPYLQPDVDFGLSRSLLLMIGMPILLIGYIWFVNLYNFMDGIDGISAIETIAVLTGIVGIAVADGSSSPVLVVFPLIFAGAALGFLVWNWHPAKVFLGDVGSIPLGIAVGFFLLTFAAYGYLFSAMILPLYYIADATFTLFLRFRRGEKVWEAHRSHWYQRAALMVGHKKTALIILAGNAGLVVLAYLALDYPVPAFAGALGWTLLLLGLLSRLARPADSLTAA